MRNSAAFLTRGNSISERTGGGGVARTRKRKNSSRGGKRNCQGPVDQGTSREGHRLGHLLGKKKSRRGGNWFGVT